jgi:hypothetical protein
LQDWEKPKLVAADRCWQSNNALIAAINGLRHFGQGVSMNNVKDMVNTFRAKAN